MPLRRIGCGSLCLLHGLGVQRKVPWLRNDVFNLRSRAWIIHVHVSHRTVREGPTPESGPRPHCYVVGRERQSTGTGLRAAIAQQMEGQRGLNDNSGTLTGPPEVGRWRSHWFFAPCLNLNI